MKSIYRPADFDGLTARLDALAPDSSRQWGRMSPHGAVCHLTDALRLIMGERDRTVQFATNRSLGARIKAGLARVYALTSHLPWPKGVPTSGSADQERDGTQPGDWHEDMTTLLGAMERFRDRGGRDLPPHIMFGPLSSGEWGRWGYRHVDHHLRQFGA